MDICLNSPFDIVRHVHRLRHNWLGHILRMSEESTVKQTVLATGEGGLLAKSVINNVIRRQHFRPSSEDLSLSAADREQWKALNEE